MSSSKKPSWLILSQDDINALIDRQDALLDHAKSLVAAKDKIVNYIKDTGVRDFVARGILPDPQIPHGAIELMDRYTHGDKSVWPELAQMGRSYLSYGYGNGYGEEGSLSAANQIYSEAWDPSRVPSATERGSTTSSRFLGRIAKKRLI